MSIVEPQYENFSCYDGNSNLKACGVKIHWSLEALREYNKCRDDPVYFIKTYVMIVHVDKGKVPFKLYPFQEKMVETFHENRFVIGKIGRQSGKCFTGGTMIKVRNKKTGEIKEISAEKFHEIASQGQK